MLRRTRADRYATAIHEAGHAVIGRRQGLLCGDVSIVPNIEEGSVGHAVICSPDEQAEYAARIGREISQGAIMRAIIHSRMAGGAAVSEILAETSNGLEQDERSITDVLDFGRRDGLRDAQFYAVVERMRSRTRSLVLRHRLDIVNLAEALMKRKTMTGTEVDALLGVNPPRKRRKSWDAYTHSGAGSGAGCHEPPARLAHDVAAGTILPSLLRAKQNREAVPNARNAERPGSDARRQVHRAANG